jgi:succinate dehydrogenase / fumarate reductase flavoprotein subunit
MQGLADGYFVIPYTLGDYLAGNTLPKVSTDDEAFKEAGAAVNARTKKLLSVEGKRTPRDLHRALGHVMWDKVGMSRNEQGLREAVGLIRDLRTEFWQNVRVTGSSENVNHSLEYAGRVADYMEFAELIALDALNRRESCGGHFREESQTPDNEALRDDENYSYVSAWEYGGEAKGPLMHKEELVFEHVKPTQRSYK